VKERIKISEIKIPINIFYGNRHADVSNRRAPTCRELS
jgi:hypothetical protein